MLRAVLRLLIPCLSLVVSLTALTHDAGACSGGSGVIELVPAVLEAEVILLGRIQWVDESGFNGMIAVKRYLNGRGGPDEIIVSMMDTRSIVYLQERELPTCDPEQTTRAMITGNSVIMFLERSQDGIYKPTAQHIFGSDTYAQFLNSDSKASVRYSLTDSPDDYQQFQLTRRQLIELIQSVPGMTTVRPTEAQSPLRAPLMVTTTSGRHYRIPVDGAPAEEISLNEVFRRNLSCWSAGCTAWAPEGLDTQTVGEGPKQRSYGMITTHPAINGAVTYSPLGDAFANWEETPDGVMLKVGALRVVTSTYFNPGLETPPPVTTLLHFNAPLAAFSNLGAWSPDGRTFAFVDANGLWFWDVFVSESSPVLSVYRDVTAVHGYSWTGRYLSVTDTDGKHYIDLMTGEDLPDGAWGPDDRALLVYGGEPRVLYTVPYREVPLFREKTVEVRYGEWTRRWAFIALMCDEEEICGIVELAIQNLYHPNRYNPLPYIGYAFDYSPDTRNLAVVKHSDTLTIRDAGAVEHREIDLSGQLDGAIVSVEWLPSVFYDARYDGTAW